jgi:hypothetical protein
MDTLSQCEYDDILRRESRPRQAGFDPTAVSKLIERSVASGVPVAVVGKTKVVIDGSNKKEATVRSLREIFDSAPEPGSSAAASRNKAATERHNCLVYVLDVPDPVVTSVKEGRVIQVTSIRVSL